MKSLLLLLLVSQYGFAQLIYPKAKSIPMAEFRFGEVISDEFKWMENPHDPDLWDWIKAEQALTRSQLEPTTMTYFYNRLIEIQEHKEALQKADKNSKSNTKLANSFLPISDSLKSKVFISTPVDEDNQIYSYKSQSIQGGDLQRIVITKKEDNTLQDILLTKFFSFVKWESKDTFLYITAADGSIGETDTRLLRHKVGQNQADDEVLYTSSHSKTGISFYEDKDSNNFIVETDYRNNTNSIFQFDLKTKEQLHKQDIDGSVFSLVNKNEITLLSFKNSNNGEILSLDIESGKTKTLIKEQDFVLSNFFKINDELSLLQGSKDAEGKLFTVNKEFKLTEVVFPKNGNIRFTGLKDDVMSFLFQSYSVTPTTYTYNLKEKVLSKVSSHNYPTEVEEVKTHYTATNGQQAAITIVKAKDFELTPKTPMIIYGYGGFQVTLLPNFNPISSMPWLEKGGAIAIVSLPGSLTYGKEWNEMAQFDNRTNAWDSFANAGKKLIELGYTSKNHIGMAGGSNGGLLVAGTLQRHPNLFKAATPMVGVLDLLNYNLFSAGKYWEWEYGNPFKEEIFYKLVNISPFHNIEKINYPAVMVMTAEFDDRVAPSHSFKYTARMQKMTTGTEPILLYTKEWGGHSSRSGSEHQKHNYTAAMFSFFAKHLGLNL